MSRTIFMLSFALVLLGFLASTSMNLYADVEALRAENKRMFDALSQVGSQYNVVLQERDLLRNQSMELSKKIEILQQAYVTENQARVTAEIELTRLQSQLEELMRSPQRVSESDGSTQPNPPLPEKISLTTILPIGTALFVLGAVLGMNQYRVNRKQTKTLPKTRHFPSSIPRS